MDSKTRSCIFNKDFVKGFFASSILATCISIRILLQSDIHNFQHAFLIAMLPVIACCSMYTAIAFLGHGIFPAILSALAFAFSSVIFSFESFSLIAALPYAITPVFSLPAIYAYKKSKSNIPALALLLLTIPFAFLIFFYLIPSSPSIMKMLDLQTIFPLPIQLRFTKEMLIDIYHPLQNPQSSLVLSLYHLPAITTIVGVIRNIKDESPLCIFILALTLILSSLENIAGIPPLAWLNISAIIITIFIAQGVQTISHWMKDNFAARTIFFFAFYIDIALCSSFYAYKLFS